MQIIHKWSKFEGWKFKWNAFIHLELTDINVKRAYLFCLSIYTLNWTYWFCDSSNIILLTLYMLGNFLGIETVHRQDSSPTRILKTVHRQNWRQFTDRIEDSSSTIFMLYLYGMSQFSPFIDRRYNEQRPIIKLIKSPICYCNVIY